MATRRKDIKPVDRALADVQAQIETLERQLRAANTPPAPPSRVASFKSFVKEMLTPPARQAPAGSARRSHDLPDVTTNPMHDLEAEAIPFVQNREPDLFTQAGRQPALAGEADDRLGRYLAAGSTRPPKPTLKRVQRETRNRFFMWLGLSLVTLWLIIVVVR
ncbi:MAG: hypothetical protein PCFJNLEI_01958 [Verrucomicrobiae bacterium]|nr:hypothetical protein [Verrucomicrobiae bacterium]